MSRCDERWARKGCAFWVSKRQYSEPGPCENRRDVRPVQHEGEFVRACAHHRGMVENGYALRTTAWVRAEGKRQIKLIERFRRQVLA